MREYNFTHQITVRWMHNENIISHTPMKIFTCQRSDGIHMTWPKIKIIVCLALPTDSPVLPTGWPASVTLGRQSQTHILFLKLSVYGI